MAAQESAKSAHLFIRGSLLCSACANRFFVPTCGLYHTFGVPDHGHPYCVDVAAQNSYNSTGAGGFATGGNQKVVTGAWNGWPDAATDGKIIGGGGGFAGSDRLVRRQSAAQQRRPALLLQFPDQALGAS